MDPPPITLIIVKGPRKGETIGFQPGSTIRIGRFMRGNNVPIKDPGISSKHLVIESGSGKWILRDLGSSNGTTLNSDLLPADTPFDLHDGDTLKLGESASILIKLEGRDGGGDQEEAEVAPLVVVESRRKNLPRRGKALKNETESFKKELDNLELEKKENVRVRVTRSRKKEDSVNCGSVLENHEAEAKKTKTSRPRAMKKNQPEEKLVENETNLRDEMVAEPDPELNPSQNQETDVRLDKDKTKDSKTEVKESCDERVEVNLGNHETEAKRRKAGRPRVRKNNRPEKNLEENETNLRKDEVVAEAETELDPSQNEEIDIRKDEEKAEDPKSEIQKSCDERVEVDLEKMTLKEWFDYLELHLPKTIIESTEEMIKGMRKKADRVGEYMVEQKMKQGKAALG